MSIRGTKSDVTFLLILLAVSLGFNVYLARRAFRSPEPSRQAAAAVRQPPAPPQLAVGTALPPLEVKDLTGETRTIDWAAAEPTVLYFFSPQCSWCAKNLDNVRRLEAELRGRYRFLGVSVVRADLDAYLESNPLDFPIYSEPTPEGLAEYGLAGVPWTIVVSAEGNLLQSWSGAYADQLRPAVEGFFDVELPGLIEDST
jgi:peroxiredoxin